MMRHGTPIENYPLTHSVNPGITHSIEFTGMDAAAAAGLNLWDWENNKYPPKFMQRIMAWHQKKREKEIHIQDARLIAEERAIKKK